MSSHSFESMAISLAYVIRRRSNWGLQYYIKNDFCALTGGWMPSCSCVKIYRGDSVFADSDVAERLLSKREIVPARIANIFVKRYKHYKLKEYTHDNQ